MPAIVNSVVENSIAEELEIEALNDGDFED